MAYATLIRVLLSYLLIQLQNIANPTFKKNSLDFAKSHLIIRENSVHPASVVRDLGVWIDHDLSMSTHATKVVAGCFAVLRQLNSFRRSVSRKSLIGLALSLDYCNAVLAGLPPYQLDRLQSAVNTAARMIYRASRYDYVSSLLKELHWLRVPERIEFKLCAQASERQWTGLRR